MHHGNGLAAKLISCGILQGYECFDGQVCRHPIIDIVSPKFEARALEGDHDLRVGLELCGDSTDDGHGRKILGGRVNHQRFDFFPHVELVGAIAPIDVLHLQVGERGVESQFDGIGQTRTHIREDGSMKHRTHLLASPQPTHCYEKTDEQGTSLRKSSR